MNNTKKIIILLALASLACGLTAPASAALQQTPQTATNAPTMAVEPPNSPTPPICTVTVENLHLRAAPDAGAVVIAWLRRGDTLTLTADSARDGWRRVTTPTGAAGWVNATYTNCEAKK